MFLDLKVWPYEDPDWEEVDESNWYDVEESIAESFIDEGVQCVIGFDEPIFHGYATIFSDYFFNKAAKAYSFLSCFNYAKGKVDTHTSEVAVIEKQSGILWRNLRLVEEDSGDSSSEAMDLGSGSGSPETTWNVFYQGLWGEFDTQDWYKFQVTGALYTVKIWVTPRTYCELDVTLKVYDNSMTLIKNVDSGGQGATEYCSFYALGYYYIRVSHPSSEHGGYFTLLVKIVS